MLKLNNLYKDTENFAKFLEVQIVKHGTDIYPELNTLEEMISLIDSVSNSGKSTNLAMLENILHDVMLSNPKDQWARVHYNIVRYTRIQAWSLLSGGNATYILENAKIIYQENRLKL